MPTSRECWVIQRKQRDGRYLDWTNPMNGQVEYGDHGQAARALLRRANAVDYRIIRRVWSYIDFAP